jgi:hypothetical protein
MKNVLTHIGVSAAALFLFGIAPIQAQETAKANTPFSFHSKIASYQSGDYEVKLLSNTSQTLVLQDLTTRHSSFVPASSTIEASDKSMKRGPVLIFKCDGDCYLTEVWTSGSNGYAISHPTVSEDASVTRIVALVRSAR